ncbi:DUF3883 domain-containing protein [Qipengyuania marisflavi]|uniref:DUF3883 domain-containing protein n=1 Tax=Qipengyuania marisflavi TaxID=2486356 RepID=A0A5S3NZY2_9SPHN|nr:DUF3883 domain-containing protein [Qipengyuania marisflavi]TMM44983.1 DUF3883 domain-containing protein [Qipengyuania marisflavi]
MAGEDWTEPEIDAIVADYFAMLADDIARRSYNKAGHNRDLQERIDRSRGSIEFKHQNISAVLLGLGQPWIPGYKPAANFQNALVDRVLRWLDHNEDWLVPQGISSPLREPVSAKWIGLESQELLEFGPVPSQRNEPPPVDSEFMARIALKYDVATRDARNRALGKAGEERVLAHERVRLRSAGRLDLSRKVRWTSAEDGDGYGYDISSFEPDGSDRLLEVKTTNGWERTPFHISSNELAVADDRREHWHLVRLWDFARQPKAFSLRPPLNEHADLSPTSFLASLK